MADNTKTYKAVIETEVKGEQQVKSLGDEVQDSSEKFKSLRTQIRETTVELQKLETQGKTNSKEFQDLRRRLDDLNDAQDRANFKAGQFDDQLAALPGPIGQVGSAIKTFNENVNRFGKGLTAALGVVGLIITAFLTMKKALESTAEGQAVLTRITTAFQKVLGPVLAIVEKVAVPIFEGFARVLEFVAVGFSKVATALGISQTKINEASSGIDDFAAKQKEQADAAAAAAEKAKAAAEKAAAEAKQRREEERRARLEYEKELTTAALSLIGNREREIAEETIKYNEQLNKYRNKSAADRRLFEEAYRKKIIEINAKYDKEEADRLQKRLDDEKKELENWVAYLDGYYKKQEDLKRASDFGILQSEIDTLRATNDLRNDDFEQDNARLELVKERLLQQRQLELDATKGLEDEAIKRLEITKKYGDAIGAVDREITNNAKAEIEARIMLQNQLASAIGSAFGAISQLFEQGSAASKAFALAEIAINTGIGFVNGLRIAQQTSIAKGPLAAYAFPIFYATQVAAVLSAANRARQILATPKASGGSTSTAPSARGNAPEIPVPNIPTIGAPQLNVPQQTTPGAQIASTLAETSQKPVEAYVVSTKISSQQALDRRTNAAATF